MRVLINGRFLDKPVTGVERFGREVTRALGMLKAAGDARLDGLDLLIVRPQSNSPALTPLIPELRVGESGGQLWEQWHLPRSAQGCDVILNLCNMAPFASRRNITCVHDAHPWLIPQNFSWQFRKWYDLVIPRIIATSARWTTVSRFSADKLVELGIANRAPDAITYNAADNFGSDVATGTGRPLPEGVRSPYVLCLGSRSANKNIGMIAGIAPRLAERGICVVVAGGGNTKVFGGGEQRIEDNVVNLGFVSDETLVALYCQASAFLFPSLYEGFGVPAIEAMKFGCPVIASDSSALPEVLGDAAILLPPHAPDRWLDSILTIHDDPVRRAKLVGKGHERVKQYSWKGSALAFAALAQDMMR